MTYLNEQIIKIINSTQEKYVENEEIMRIIHPENTTIGYAVSREEMERTRIIRSVSDSYIFKKYVLNHSIFKENSNAFELMAKKYGFDANEACIKFVKGDKHAFDDLLKFMENDPRLEKFIQNKPSERNFLHKFVDGSPFLQSIMRKISSFSRFWSDVIAENPGRSSLIVLIFIIVSVGFYKKYKNRT